MKALQRIVGGGVEARDTLPLSFDEFLSYFSINGLNYGIFGGLNTTINAGEEKISGGYESLAKHAFKRNGVIFACTLVRMMVFQEARFQFRDISQGRPGKLFGTQSLAPLEMPWQGATTSDLLGRAELDVSIGGNFYATRRVALEGRARRTWLKRMRPDWVTVLLGSKNNPGDGFDLDAQIIGYFYQPGGPAGGEDPIPLLPEDVAHYAPIPDPEGQYVGMSWMTPILRDVEADNAATTFKRMYLEKGATPNLIITMDVEDPDKFTKWVQLFREEHEGVTNAFKTLYLKAGMSAQPVGANLKDVEFKATQGGGEVRIAMAAGVPAQIVGLAAALEGSSLNQGNYQGARRRFSDGTMRPLWRNFCGSIAHLIQVPAAAELWYDDRDIPFLQEDQKDAAEIQSKEASTINSFVTSGFTPESAVAAVVANDLNLLEHTGLLSVQLLPPGAGGDAQLPAEASAALAMLYSRMAERYDTRKPQVRSMADLANEFTLREGKYPTNDELAALVAGTRSAQ